MNSNALKKQAEQNYKDLINAKLDESYARIKSADNKPFVVENDYFQSVLERVQAQKSKVS